MKANNKDEKYRKIKEKKMETSPEVLCKGFPSEFVNYFKYVKEL